LLVAQNNAMLRCETSSSHLLMAIEASRPESIPGVILLRAELKHQLGRYC